MVQSGKYSALFIIWILAGALLFGCEREQRTAPEETPASSLAPSPVPTAAPPAPAASAPAAEPASQVRVPVASVAAGRIFDAAGYGSKPGLSFAVDRDGTAWHWGWGFGSPEADTGPKRVTADRPVTQVTQNYLLGKDGHVMKRGTKQQEALQQVEGLSEIISIQQLDEMFGTLFALRKDGTVWYLPRETGKPLRFGNFSGVSAIYGTSFSLFVQEQEGRLWYAAGLSGDILKPENHKVLLLQGVASVTAGYEDEALIRLDNNEVLRYLPREQKLAAEPRLAGAVKMAVAGEGTYLFTRSDGTVWGFGKNGDGLLGPGTETVLDPVQIQGLEDIVGLEAGNHHALALDEAGRVYTWGRNMDGQLGRVPVILDRWKDMGELTGVRKAVAASGRPYFIMEDGTLRAMQPDRTFGPVPGVAELQELQFVLGYPVTLDKTGAVRLWEKDFSSSQPLTLTNPVKRMAAGGDRLLLLDDRGNLDLVFLREAVESMGQEAGAASPSTTGLVPAGAEKLAAEGGWTGRIRSLYGNPYVFMALTEDGKVFYADRNKEGGYQFRSIMGTNPVKELSVDDYVLHTAEPLQVWALEETGDLREIRLDMEMEWRNNTGKLEILSVTPQVQSAHARNITRISGSLQVHADGTAGEDRHKLRLQAQLPAPVKLLSSFYNYNIEGPGLHYHVLVNERNQVSLLGYNPFGQMDPKPGIVPFP